MSITAALPSQKNCSASFEAAWQRLSLMLEEPGAFAIQFVFSSDYELHSALLRRLQQTALSLTVDCLELPKTSSAELSDTGASSTPTTAQQLAEAITRHCLANIFPPTPPHPRLLLLDLHQALPTALATLLHTTAVDGERSAILQQALADSRALLLSRLNERRAQLAAYGPLLILLPEDWTKPAAEYAPDLWTQRLSSLYLPPPIPCAEDHPGTELALSESSAEAAPRAAERNILARWQEALCSGQTQRLPVSDGWIAANTSAKLGNGQEAEDLAALCLRLAYERGSLREQMISQGTLGDMRLRRGRIEQAREAYTVALSVAQELVSKEPDNSEWQRDLSVSYDKVADILRRSDPAAALVNYQASLKIRQDLAQREPDNTEWQRDLSVSYNKVADILRRSDPAATLVNYQASLNIRQDLARREPDNTTWQRDLLIGHSNVADILCRSDPAAALANYQASLKIAQDLARREPDNTEWQRDLSISYDKVADILRRSDPAAALTNYQAGLKIAQSLTQREPDNTEWQRDLSVSYANVADILRHSDPTAALENHQASLNICLNLAQHEPDNLELQTDQIISHVKIAELNPTVPTAEARAHLQAALQLARQLASAQLLTHDQAGWPDEIQQRLDALPPA
ncbi:MAG: hypothetical protein L6Q55_04460 [Azonexus sp.]|nr:hypothetical protein [Azonexus sp.]MCK6411661.1 hypothetical protein [Azonexus sp.]